MADDQDLLDGFRPLADATFAAPRPRSVLEARVRHRQRRRREVAGGVAAALAAIGGLAVARVAGSPPPADVATRATATTAPGGSAGLGTGPRLVIGWLPKGLSSGDCAWLPRDAPTISCPLGIPTTPVPDGAHVTWMPGAATAEIRAAWVRRDARAVVDATVGPRPGAAFTVIDGGPVLALGEMNRVAGSSVEQPDRVQLGWLVVAGEDVVEVMAEGLSTSQVEQLVAGISTAPEDPGFTVPDGTLPAGARPVAQGPQRPWLEPDPLRPDLSAPVSGKAYGITYSLPGSRSLLLVTVIRDIDVTAFLASWSDVVRRATGSQSAPVERKGRSGLVFTPRLAGDRVQVAIAADDHTVVLVKAPAHDQDMAVTIAASVTVASAATL